MRRPAAAAAVLAGALLLAGCGGGSGAAPDLSVGSAYIPQPVSDSMAAGFLTITNKGEGEDELTSVTSEAGEVSVHRTVDGRMKAADRLPIPARGELVLESGANHLMFEKLTRRLQEGETVTVELRFAHSDPVTVTMPVKSATYRPADGHSGH
ncbi:copper chaperone PCu(A)C [Streptomyces tagetis]|uniref:Copper chaperone PCu(A)C n=1 Tax=Streptomyces tagetis TaxID=2820809 RepID=A0A940XNG2_9ACTN|nr:copper chaperone PCu(A)C [Streptomyces sp. RG38]MBQ0827804.1 copper chaperone PCu(A)C [Streptomyces sp. RG38]